MPNGEPSNVRRLALSAKRAEDRVRQFVADSGNVILSNHAIQRMEQRGFDDTDVHNILRKGIVEDAPEEIRDGDWKCKVTMRMKGGRHAGVVTIILSRGKLLVMTVEWEDGR